MKITLELIRDILSQYLGGDSYISIVIKDVQEANVGTLAIDKKQTLYYDKKFVETHIKSPSDLFTVIMHEIFHPLCGHLFSTNDVISNIAKDAIINAFIYNLFYPETNGGNFFKRFYKDTGEEGLLRPKSNLRETRYSNVYYNYLYGNDSITSDELIILIKNITPKPKNIQLIGSHGEESLPSDILEKIAQELEVKSKGCTPVSNNIFNMLKEVIKNHLSIKDDILKKFAVKRKFDNFLVDELDNQVFRSPIPKKMSRRDMLLVMNDYPVIFYNNQQDDIIQTQMGKINIYLDVSGSVDAELPNIIGIMKNIETKIRDIYLFSTFVAKTKMKDLCEGKISTSGGTSFDCVAQSILDNKIEKALIFTDGYAHLSRNLLDELKKTSPMLMVVIFGNGRLENNTFQSISEVVDMKDILR